ncbi:acyl-CoA synthetase [Streptomyces cinereoruber]|uniref:Acyl-CoA synthetase n=1 Tax=Streptomyces cinereoruber TaxID=67260 RepID=A0AAV4KT86_9ACTN|nr:bifunctional GNAT family N-acetyltransferase/acetate--CoA ligase family protein [Streptomyces cinereoruber]MBB4162204.1 acyl-CoA synthetase (NDP forming)/RimJ/RimL family protein N-acetyltransferase [Streptomyces cinereoruber]NIH62593.1 acyl-CoA synthetase (NDP forming)/RimJ/RimL family protein N-acetyltransferase [Streptomyces cinereoruber]GGR49274.1 acyl-CoA synthetase [Streptomyces cinereoruber]
MQSASEQSEATEPQAEPARPAPPEHAYPDHWEADVVLRDGGTARIRPITTDDADRLVSFYEQVSDESKYYRFFAPYPRLSAKDVHRFTHHDFVDRVGLAATVGGEFIATVRYDRIDDRGLPASAPADEAEVAFLVQDAHQGRGVASALLEHIAAVARERGIRRFAAEVLPANTKMIKVFTDAGYTQKRSFEDGSVRLHLDLEPTDRSLAVQRAREQRAEARSVQRLLTPASVAVVGAGRAPGGVGRTVLRNLLGAGFTGRVYAVNAALPATGGDGGGPVELDGVPAYRSVGAIGEPVDLAIVAVPAERVPEAVADCGEHGVRGLVVLSAGYAESGPEGRERQRRLVQQARSYGMRIIGPNAFGIINTADDVRLNASLAPQMPAAGRIGLFTQSGAIGIALLAGLHRRGAGLSSFISAGNRADVSGNDFLQHWYDDPGTDVVLLYLESIGNPRKFTRLARRTAAVKPVVVVKGARHSGSAPPGHRVPVTRVPHATVSALLRQAGVIRVDTVTELVDAGLLLAAQPLPAGPRVAILGNSESLGLLTYDACLTEGLRPLRPLDLTTAAVPADFRDALVAALADETSDAVVVTAIPWVGEDGATEFGDGEVLAAALREAVASAPAPAKPVVVVHVEMGGLAEALAAATSTRPPAAGRGAGGGTGTAGGAGTGVGPVAVASVGENRSAGPAAPGSATSGSVAPESATSAPTAPGPVPATAPPAAEPAPSVPVPGHVTEPAPPGPVREAGPVTIPAYPAAERAVRALAEAVRYGQWRRQAADPGRVPEYEDIDETGAAALIRRVLGGADARGATLGTDQAGELLARYGITVLPTLPAPTPDAAVAAAARLGYPVALKTTAPHLRHRPDLGGVRLDLATEEQLRTAYAELTEVLGKPEELQPVVQAMVPRGVDTVVRSAIDPAVGAVLSFGLSGAASELLGDTAHRLVPATDRDAAELVRSLRTTPLLFGWRGSAPVDTPALEELLLRVSRLVDDHPEVVAVSLEPVVVAPRGLSVLGATVRLAPPPPRTDLGPRSLPNY